LRAPLAASRSPLARRLGHAAGGARPAQRCGASGGSSMTRALRGRHRHVVGLLAIALPAGLLAAIAARPALPAEPRHGLGAPRAEDLPPFDGRTRAAVRLFGSASNAPVRVAVRIASPDATARETSRGRLELQLESEVPQPELLAYWAPATPGPLAARADDL